MTNLQPTTIDGAWLMTPTQFPSFGGSFMTVSPPPGLCPMLGWFSAEQVSLSTAVQGTIRGIHYTTNAQKKIVSCVRGAVWDVVVDLRLDSSTFGQWFGAELSEDNRIQMVIGAGLGHGYCVRSPHATLLYQLSRLYDPKAEREIDPLDFELGTWWDGDPDRWAQKPFLSERDRNAPPLSSLREVL